MGMVESKWVRILADYCADPLWGPDGSMESLEDLPVSQDLRARLETWEEWYDLQSLDNPEFDAAAFGRAGLELAREVKAQLPDWTVVYFDEAAWAARTEETADGAFQYEITD